MNTLMATVLASNPIAYWPLLNEKDLSGNNYTLTLSGSPTFNNNPLNSDFRPSYLSSNTGMARIRQDLLPPIVSLECYFKLPGMGPSWDYTIMGMNMPLSGATIRSFLCFIIDPLYGYGGLMSFKQTDSGNVFYSSTKSYAELSTSPHHLLMQYDDIDDKTYFYIDGVLDTALTQNGTMFSTNSDRWLCIGVRYNGGSAYGICNVSDVAIYGRKLTSDELNSRQQYTNFPPADIKQPLGQHLSWANQETREQAWPGETSLKKTTAQSPEKVCPITSVSALNAPPARKNFGFIEGVVTRKSIPAAGKHVICLDARFNLIAETISATNGYYRFDSLPINGLYAIHAYDNDTYQYAPVGADRRSPEAYQ